MQTCSLDIFKLKDENTTEYINKTIKENLEEKSIDYDFKKRTIEDEYKKYDFYFYYGSKIKNDCPIDWYEMIKMEFNDLPDCSKDVCSNYGILIIDGNIKNANKKTRKIEFVKNIKYAIPFGYGNNIIMKLCDYNYGLEMAGRIAKESSIKTQSSKYFSSSKNKSLTLYHNANFITEVGESIDILTAEINEQPEHKSVVELLNLINNNVMFSVFLRISLIKEFSLTTIIKIIGNLDNILKNYQKDVLIIPKLSKLSETKDKELIDKLNENLKHEALKGQENISFSFGMYKNIKGKIILLSEVEEVTLLYKKKNKTYNELNIENVIDFMKENDITDITSLKIRIGNDENSKIIEYIDYTIQLDNPNEYYCLDSGQWAKFNKTYIDKIERDIETKIKKITEFKDGYKIENLEKLRENYSVELTGEKYEESKEGKLYKERVYNCHLSHILNGVLTDRNTNKTNKIEVADIYTKDTHELIHVKIGKPGVFIECINQSISGAHYYKNNPEKVKEAFNYEIEKVDTITMLLVTDNITVLNSQDICKFNSLRFKLNLLEWYKQIDEMGYNKRIIIVPDK